MANILTVLRVALIPGVVYALLVPVPGGRLTAATVFGVAALTDLFDGMIARRAGSVTEFGKLVDPLADRALVMAVLVALVLAGNLPLWAAAVVIGRDVAMMVGYKAMQLRGAKPRISLAGKVSTAVLMISIAMLVLVLPGAVLAFYAGMVLSVVSGFAYVLAAARGVAGEGLKGGAA